MKQFWHMQMYPTDEPEFFDKYGRMILEHKKFIGLGDWDEDRSQIPYFLEKMQVGDIVAIKRGEKLIALVEVTSKAYQVMPSQNLLDWLAYRRDVKILTWADDKQTIPMKRCTLMRCVDDNAETSKIIQNWYQDCILKLDELGFVI